MSLDPIERLTDARRDIELSERVIANLLRQRVDAAISELSVVQAHLVSERPDLAQRCANARGELQSIHSLL